MSHSFAALAAALALSHPGPQDAAPAPPAEIQEPTAQLEDVIVDGSGLEALALEFIKSHSRRVTDMMTHNVVTVAPETSLAEVAKALEKHRIKRVPVVEDGKLVGIVSRADLVRTLADLYKRVSMPPASDEDLRQGIVAELANQTWAHPRLINVDVHDGTVDLNGLVESSAEKHAIRVAAESLPGVKAVNDGLRIYRGNTVF